MNLEEFKIVAPSLKKELGGRVDDFNAENGTAVIYAENLNKYLEKYMCKDAEDLEDTLYYKYGVFCKIVN